MPNLTTLYLSKAWHISYCSTIRSHPDDLWYRVTTCCTLNNSTCCVGEVYPVGRLFDVDRTSCVILSNSWNRGIYFLIMSLALSSYTFIQALSKVPGG